METDKIYCEDCITGMRRLPDNSVDLVITSPPYNKHISTGRKGRGGAWKRDIDYGTYVDDLDEEAYQKWQSDVIKECIRIIKRNGSIFYNHKYRFVKNKIISPEEWLSKFNIRQVIIWNRGSSPMIDPVRFMPTIEQIYWITKDRSSVYITKEGFLMKDVWRFNADFKNSHPAPFPVELPLKCIRACCPENGIVLDPFMGSGTTAVACKMLGKKFIGFEINPDYVKSAEKRIGEVAKPLFNFTTSLPPNPKGSGIREEIL